MKVKWTRVLRSFVLAFAAAVLSAFGAFADGAPTGHTRFVRRLGYDKDGNVAETVGGGAVLEGMSDTDESWQLGEKLMTSQAATLSIWVKGLDAANENATSVFGAGSPRIYKEDGSVFAGNDIQREAFGLFYRKAGGVGSYGIHLGKCNDAAYTEVTAAAPTDGKWHRLTAVYAGDGTGSAGTLKLYVDGVLQATGAAPKLLVYAGVGDSTWRYGARFHIGFAWNTTTHYAQLRGYLADAVLWDSALTDAQVAADAAKRLAYTGDEGMIAYWPLEESNQPTALTPYGECLVNPYYSFASSLGNKNYGQTVEVDDFPVGTPAFRNAECTYKVPDGNFNATLSGAVQDGRLMAAGETVVKVSSQPYDDPAPFYAFAPDAEDGTFSVTSNLYGAVRRDDQMFFTYVATVTVGDETCVRRVRRTCYYKDHFTYTWTGGGDGTSWTDPANWNCSSSTGNLRGYPGSYAAQAVIGSAAKDRTITVGEDISLFRVKFANCGDLTLDMGGHVLYVGNAEDRGPDKNSDMASSGDSLITVTNAFPTIANAALVEYRSLGPAAGGEGATFGTTGIKNGVRPAPAAITFKDCAAVRARDVIWGGYTDLGITIDNSPLTYRHWNYSTGGGNDGHNLGPVRVVNGGTLACYRGSCETTRNIYLGFPDTTYYIGSNSTLSVMAVKIGPGGYSYARSDNGGSFSNISVVAEHATLDLGVRKSARENLDIREGGELIIEYGRDSEERATGVGHVIALTNCTTVAGINSSCGIYSKDYNAKLTNCSFIVSGGTFESRADFLAQGGRGNRLVVDGGAEMTLEGKLTAGKGCDFVLDDATVAVGGALTFFSNAGGDDAATPKAVFTGAAPHMTAGGITICNSTTPGTLEFAPPAAGWTDPALEFAGAGDFKDAANYHIQVTAPAGGFKPNVIRIPLLRFGSSKTTYEAANFPENLAPGTFILPEGVEVRYEKDTYLLYAYIPAHAELASEIKSASVQCQDYTNLVFSGSLVRSLGETTVKVVWGDDDAALTNETVLATIAKDAEDLTFAGELSFRFGTDIRWKVVSSVVNAGFLFEDATLPRDASTAPWQGRITKVGTGNILSAVGRLPITVEPGAGDNVVTFEYGYEPNAYVKKYTVATVRAGDDPVLENLVPVYQGKYVYWRAILTNTDPDGRGTSSSTNESNWKVSGIGGYAWNPAVAEGNWTDPANWSGKADGETVYYPNEKANVVFAEFTENRGQANYRVNLDATVQTGYIYATNVASVVIRGTGTAAGPFEIKTTKDNYQTTLYNSNFRIENLRFHDNAGFDNGAGWVNMRGERPNTFTVGDGATFVAEWSNAGLASHCDPTASGEPHRVVVERGAEFRLFGNNAPGLALNTPDYVLDFRPGSRLCQPKNYNVLLVGEDPHNSHVRGVPTDLVLDGLESISMDDIKTPDIEISSGSTLAILNMTNVVENMPPILFFSKHNGSSYDYDATNAFLHVSNVVLSVANGNYQYGNPPLYNGRIFLQGFGNEVLVEDSLLPGHGYGSITFNGGSSNCLVTVRNTEGFLRGEVSLANGQDNTLVLDDARLCHRQLEKVDVSSTVLGAGAKDGTLVVRGANPVYGDYNLTVGSDKKYVTDFDHVPTVRLEVPAAGWAEAPFQARNKIYWYDGTFNVEVVLPEGGLDEGVGYVPVAASADMTIYWQGASEFATWTVPDGWEVVYDATAKTIGLRVTGVTDNCATFAKAGIASHRYYGFFEGSLADLGRFGNATVKVVYGTEPDDLRHEATIAAFDAESATLDFAWENPEPLPLASWLYAQYTVESTDPATGRAYARRSPLLTKQLSPANSDLMSDPERKSVDGAVRTPFTMTPGTGTTTVVWRYWNKNTPDDVTEVTLGVFPEDFVTNAASFTFGGTSAIITKPGDYVCQYVAYNAAGDKVDSMDSKTFSVKAFEKTTYWWRPEVRSGNWSDAANWIVSDGSTGYPNAADVNVVIAGVLEKGDTYDITLTEDVSVNYVRFIDCSDATLRLGGRTLTACNNSRSAPCALYYMNAAVHFENGTVTAPYCIGESGLAGAAPTRAPTWFVEKDAVLSLTGTQVSVFPGNGWTQDGLRPAFAVNKGGTLVTAAALFDNQYGSLMVSGGVARVAGSLNYSAGGNGKSMTTLETYDGAQVWLNDIHVVNVDDATHVIADSELQVAGELRLGYRQNGTAMAGDLSFTVTNSTVALTNANTKGVAQNGALNLKAYPTAAIDAVFRDSSLIGRYVNFDAASVNANLTFAGEESGAMPALGNVYGADGTLTFADGCASVFGKGEEHFRLGGTNNVLVVDGARVALSNESYRIAHAESDAKPYARMAHDCGLVFRGESPSIRFATSATKTPAFFMGDAAAPEGEAAVLRFELPAAKYARPAVDIDIAPGKVTFEAATRIVVEENPACLTGSCHRARFPLVRFAQGAPSAVDAAWLEAIRANATLPDDYARTEKGGALEYREASATLYYVRPSNGIGLMVIVR